LEALPKIAKVEKLIIAIRAEIGGEVLMVDAQGIAHFVEETGYGVGADADTEVA